MNGTIPWEKELLKNEIMKTKEKIFFMEFKYNQFSDQK